MTKVNNKGDSVKIHPLLVEAVAVALREIFSSHRYADKVVEFQLMNHKKWGARDRRFFAHSVFEMVRHWRYLWWLRNTEVQLELISLRSLWGHWWAWSRKERLQGYLSILEWERLQQRLSEVPSSEILYSIPDWMHQRGLAELEGRWLEALPTLNTPARVYLRVNNLKTTAAELKNQLLEEGIESEQISNAILESLVLRERKNVFITKAFQKGLFEVQDWSSQQVAPYLDCAPGMRVIDACAGAGGKTLHLAQLMKNKGKILALDIHEWKLKELRERASRNGIDIIETKGIENQKTIKRLVDSADRLLLDVPCSGLGVLRRNPDTKWKMTSEELSHLNQVQREILNSYSRMVKSGGKLVYSTCSILPSENEHQISWFLELNKEFKLLTQKVFLPQENEGDGFFVALLSRQ